MLQQFLDVSKIYYDPKVKDKEELFALLSSRALEEGWITSAEQMTGGVKDKEEAGTVELKPHIVLPHARGAYVRQLFVLMAYFPGGLAYEGAKGRKAEVVFFIGVPEGDQNYLKLLASISRLISSDDFVTAVKRAEIRDDILFAIKKHSLQITVEEKKTKKFIIILSLNESIEEARISSFFTEIGVGLLTELQGRNIGNSLGLMSYFSAMGFGKARGQYNKTYLGVTDDEKGAAQLYALLKQAGIDLDENGKGTLMQFSAWDIYGGYPEDIF